MSRETPTRFTRQEWALLPLMLECKANKEIAAATGTSLWTVKFHVTNIYRKVGVANRSELIARYAYGN